MAGCKLRVYLGLMELVRVRRERIRAIGERFAPEREELLRKLRRVETRIVVWAARG